LDRTARLLFGDGDGTLSIGQDQ
jgi:hypothetical protein